MRFKYKTQSNIKSNQHNMRNITVKNCGGYLGGLNGKSNNDITCMFSWFVNNQWCHLKGFLIL